jgi:restriction system protein
VATPPRCPRCDKEMVLRTARHGQRAGSNFWGCQSYPGCKGTLPV